MAELYLILHKVRGEPAFDIAQRLQIGDEEGWIIPTSGHRAYPSTWIDLDYINKNLESVSIYHWITNMNPHIPDHYEVNHEPKAILTSARDLLTKLGLAKPPPAPTRRRLVP